MAVFRNLALTAVIRASSVLATVQPEKNRLACTQTRRDSILLTVLICQRLPVGCARCGIWHLAFAGCRDIIRPVLQSLVIRYSVAERIIYDLASPVNSLSYIDE